LLPSTRSRAAHNTAFATRRRRLWATTRPDNLASLRVLAKLGFAPDHTEIDDDGERVFLRLDR
jgi:RimJ/RimL family protein N-acetyltransferase